jgi:predicted GNAT family acetyltransferase
MSNVQLATSSSGKLLFFIEEDGKKIARMYADEHPPILTAIHTEVLPEGEGKGLAKQLLLAMVKYAREGSMQVVAQCPYVRAQFERRPEEYADIWKR